MPLNFQKTPLSRTLPRFARQVARGEISKRFLELPGFVKAIAGGLVTVNFDVPGLNIDQATMPVAMSKYIRWPIQVGDAGFAVSASAYLGTVSGMGSGSSAATALQPNLSALVWVPISNAGWDSVDQDVVLMDAAGASIVTISPTGITLAFGGKSVVINASGITIDGILFDTHTHSGVTTGSGDSGPPVP